MYALAQLGEHLHVEMPSDLHLVSFLNAVAWVGKLVGERPVVGDKDESFAGDVEPTDVEHAPDFGRQQVGHKRASCGVVGRADDTFGLVDGKVGEFRFRERLSVDLDMLPLTIDARAQLGHGLPRRLRHGLRGSVARPRGGLRRLRLPELFGDVRPPGQS